MDGEFICEEELGFATGIAGGNFVVQSIGQDCGLAATSDAVGAIAKIAGCVTPFPGGIARSGSKVGSRYENQIASTAEDFCPTLRGRVESRLHPQANCAYEDVIRAAMRAGIAAALSSDVEEDGVLQISAGNYGGKLGKCLVYLNSL